MSEKIINKQILEENITTIQSIIQLLTLSFRGINHNSGAKIAVQGIEILVQHTEKHGKKSRWEIAAMVDKKIIIN
ncbi:MAG: hypothetical protein US11_C0003G0003 [Candidatus Roizmanbacteria bacterium GW2011_GWA2_36_23]|uniref:Uncharacterized protein n=1 Tax=Candidatus Roizmanbacteria bacterium GW2011_GWA2_36_23 TaxID=1618480 RepID=A0A0G0EL62_9BACT|nr:MAG: hypothetical protein US11_C0003G0003 [Candidatus Roizmanbacteria bacterium GW2011_GWA2_36_23]